MDMIERVARALVVARFGQEGLVIFEPVPDGFPKSKEARETFAKRIAEARAEARAAIEAMREPTSWMLNEAIEMSLSRGGEISGYAYWQTMIDAALEDRP